MFLCIVINDSRKYKSAWKNNWEEQHGGKGMTASLFTNNHSEKKPSLVKELFLQNFRKNNHYQ